MSDWLNAPRSDYRRVTIPTIWVALGLSLLLHIAVLWVWLPRVHLLSLESLERGNAHGPLVVELAPEPEATAVPPSPPPLPAIQAQQARPAKAAPRPSSAPPAIALDAAPATAAPPPSPSAAAPMSVIALPPATPSVAAQEPVIASPPAVAPVAAPPPAIASPPSSVAAPAAAPVEGDLSSYIEAKRRARGQVAPAPPRESPPASASPPVEDERERSNRIIAANLGLGRTPTVGYDPKGGGGIFQIQRMSYDAAEFIFFGWNKDIRRNSKQLIEVPRGDNSDIRIAVVRRMIAIIRENESGDFMWSSQRLGRNVMLSARPSDNAELEYFLMQEFFADPRRLN